jgi:hypothetical protein
MIAAACLVRHGAHRRLRLAQFNADRLAVAFNSPCDHAVNEQASNPNRSRGRPRFEKRASRASGALAAPASFIIWPVSSTTQIAVSSNAMSSPAKILRGCSFPMFVTSRHRPRSHISTGAAACISSPLGKDPNHPSDSKVSPLACLPEPRDSRGRVDPRGGRPPPRIGRTGPCRPSLAPVLALGLNR